MKTISIVNMKGGVAKTTLAVNLADCLTSRNNKKVLLVDIDPQFNATQCLITGEKYKELLAAGKTTIIDIFNDAPIPTASTVTGIGQKKPFDYVDILPWPVKKNLDLLPGNIQLFKLEMSPGQGREFRLKNFLKSKEATYHYAIIDTPPTPSVWMTSALIASDYFLVPCRPEPLSASGIDLLGSVIDNRVENYGLSIKCLGLVLTMAEENTVVYRDAKKYVENSPKWSKYLFKAHLPKRTEVARGQGSQSNILNTHDSALKKALANITNEILTRIGDV